MDGSDITNKEVAGMESASGPSPADPLPNTPNVQAPARPASPVPPDLPNLPPSPPPPDPPTSGASYKGGKLMCYECPVLFSNKGALHRHMNSHRGKRWKCTRCTKIYTSDSGWRYHVKKTGHKVKVVQAENPKLPPKKNKKYKRK